MTSSALAFGAGASVVGMVAIAAGRVRHRQRGRWLWVETHGGTHEIPGVEHFELRVVGAEHGGPHNVIGDGTPTPVMWLYAYDSDGRAVFVRRACDVVWVEHPAEGYCPSLAEPGESLRPAS